MNLKQKLKVGAVALVAYFSGSHVAHAQGLDKAKAKTTHVVNKSAEYWLNATNGDRMLVKTNRLGGVEAVNASGLGWSINKNGTVSGKKGMSVRPDDVAFMNSVAYAVTGNEVFVANGYTQRDGETAVRDAENGLKTFVSSEKDKEGNRVAYVIGVAGHQQLYAPSAGEMSWAEAQKIAANAPVENDALAGIVDRARSAVDIDKQTHDELAFNSRSGETLSEKGLTHYNVAQSSQNEIN
ncbi:MAG: hypothetical protein IJ660_06190 [Alphaproteobacteria bacterium]|nr:hypothetical protein [Alphaproteobacteria bacterium]